MRRLVKLFGNEPEIEALLERMPRHTAETFCQVLSTYNSLLCESFNGLDLADLGPIR